jgi:hypothetical protein
MQGGKCDFCGANLPEQAWAFPAKSFQTDILAGSEDGQTKVVTATNTGPWLACDPCGEGVQHEKWDDLANRMVEQYLADHPEQGRERELITDHLLTVAFLVHAAYKENAVGDPYRQHVPQAT